MALTMLTNMKQTTQPLSRDEHVRFAMINPTDEERASLRKRVDHLKRKIISFGNAIDRCPSFNGKANLIDQINQIRYTAHNLECDLEFMRILDCSESNRVNMFTYSKKRNGVRGSKDLSSPGRRFGTMKH